MRPFLVSLVLLGVTTGPIASTVRAEVTAEAVRDAIAGAVGYLKDQQVNSGAWQEYRSYPGGITALCTLALLEAGVPPEDQHVQRALAYLRRIEPTKTYAVALQTMVFSKALPQRDRTLVARNVQWLEENQVTEGTGQGAWSYPGGPVDNSNSQFALLALAEAERIGVEVSGRTWRLARAYWEKCQNPDGSWGYHPSTSSGGPNFASQGTGSMTSAGIAALVLTADKVHATDARVEGAEIECCVPGADEDAHLQRGMQWLGRNFSVSRNPGAVVQIHLLYYLYGIERVGRLTAQRYIGGHDWYREGVDHLLTSRGSTRNYWVGKGPAEDERIATALALLFLSKGRRPILLSKVQYGSDDNWNQHQSDVANLTRYVEATWERDLTWQVIDIRTARVEDLLESRVLFISGQHSPLPKAAAEQEKLAKKLRDYLDRGGFLFAEANCGGEEFDRGFRQLMERVFAEPEYRLRPLPPEHPVWRTDEAVEAEYAKRLWLWGIEFGCRTSVVYRPPDESDHVRPSLSCLWELSQSGRDTEYPAEVQHYIDAGLAVGINVLAYATNRELKFKDPAARRTETNLDEAGSRGLLYLANLRHPGGCNAAPLALVNLLETVADELKLRVSTHQQTLNITDAALFDYHLVFMHGRNRFSLTESERKQLRAYVERGGVVFANSICASSAFTESFRREMATIFPEQTLAPIAPDDPLLSTDFGGFDLSTVKRRDPQRHAGTEPLEDIIRQVPPELDGIRIGNHYGVIFSRFDLSCALEKHNSLECQGYIRDDAARIGMNVVLYALQQ